MHFLNDMFQLNYDLFKLIDEYKISDIYINRNNCLGHVDYIVIIKSITRCVIIR